MILKSWEKLVVMSLVVSGMDAAHTICYSYWLANKKVNKFNRSHLFFCVNTNQDKLGTKAEL